MLREKKYYKRLVGYQLTLTNMSRKHKKRYHTIELRDGSKVEMTEARQTAKYGFSVSCTSAAHYADLLIMGYCLTCKHKFSL